MAEVVGILKCERSTPVNWKRAFFSRCIWNEILINGMAETDGLEKPGRTMLASEASINRSSHIVKINNKIRKLTSVECERINGYHGRKNREKIRYSIKYE